MLTATLNLQLFFFAHLTEHVFFHVNTKILRHI